MYGILEAKIMSGPSIVQTRSLTRRSALGIVALALVMPSVSAFAQTPAILVHKDPDCGCCAGWVQHVKDAGFAVTVEETTDLQPVKKRLGVPADLAACHTAEVGGYVLEGHVPAAAVRLLLGKPTDRDRIGRPRNARRVTGMEGGAPRRYEVVLFGATGRQSFMHFVGTENAP